MISKATGLPSWLGIVEGPGDRRTESAEDNTTVPDVSLWTQLRSLSPPAGSQHPRDPRKHSSSPHLACSTEQTETGWEAPALAGQSWQSHGKRGRSGTHISQAISLGPEDLVSNWYPSFSDYLLYATERPFPYRSVLPTPK